MGDYQQQKIPYLWNVRMLTVTVTPPIISQPAETCYLTKKQLFAGQAKKQRDSGIIFHRKGVCSNLESIQVGTTARPVTRRVKHNSTKIHS